MFGMGFMEIFLIAVVAIIALGPEKLPTAMVDIAKFLKKFKAGVEDAKSTLDNELNISEMKAEAAKYKAQIEDAKSTLNVKDNIDLGLNNIINDDDDEKPSSKKEKVSLKESKKKKKKKKENKSETVENDAVEEIIEQNPETLENEVDTTKTEDKAPVTDSGADAMNKFKVDFDELEDNK